MKQFTVEPNEFLKEQIQAFYHDDYTGYGNPITKYINVLKNDKTNPKLQWSKNEFSSAVYKLNDILLEDLPHILGSLNLPSLTVCVVPRAKTENTYQENQLLFKSTVQSAVDQLNDFNNGTEYITRHTNTKTTHLRPYTPNYNNDGDTPYSGITANTCSIASDVNGKNILLIDDIYTKTTNIDEDAIQSLIDKGASSVTFYAIGRTAF